MNELYIEHATTAGCFWCMPESLRLAELNTRVTVLPVLLETCFWNQSYNASFEHDESHSEAEEYLKPGFPVVDSPIGNLSDSESSMSSASSFLTSSSCHSDNLFEVGKDDIICEGELMKFKPGLTVNFVPRYC